MNNCTVYALYEYLEDGTIIPRYVGQTCNKLNTRLRQHIRRAVRGDMSYKNNWIRSVLDRGKEIKIVALDTMAEWNKDEIIWIKKFKQCGFNLTNLTNGGNNNYGISEERRAQLSYISLKNWQNPEFRKFMVDINSGPNNHFYGKHHSEERKKYQSVKLKEPLINLQRLKNNPRTKMDPDKVRLLREMHKSGKYNHKQLSEYFGIGLVNVASIIHKRKWAGVI